MKRLVLCAFLSVAVGLSASYAQNSDGKVLSASESLLKGLEAYRNEDWARASLLLRDAVNGGLGDDESTWYMMIMSQAYAGYHEAAVSDCDRFEARFPDSPTGESLRYQKGRLLHLLGRNTEATAMLSDFCVRNPESPMYVSALFWLAECFFDECDYASAQSIYSMIVTGHPEDSKSSDSAARLDEIGRSERERKLLYLLKLTGEEYLSLKEDYERLSREKSVSLDSSDIEFIRELVSAASESGLGIDESKLKRLNKKLGAH